MASAQSNGRTESPKSVWLWNHTTVSRVPSETPAGGTEGNCTVPGEPRSCQGPPEKQTHTEMRGLLHGRQGPTGSHTSVPLLTLTPHSLIKSPIYMFQPLRGGKSLSEWVTPFSHSTLFNILKHLPNFCRVPLTDTWVRLASKLLYKSDPLKAYEALVPQSCLTLPPRWTAARQAPLSMGFSRQEYWSGLPFPSPGNLPHPGIELTSPALQADSLLSELPGNVPLKAPFKRYKQESFFLNRRAGFYFFN